MDRIKKSRLGFTLVELMVAALAFSVLALAVGSMLVFGWRGWKRNNDLVSMQRDATLTITAISKEIRNATFEEITDGAGISFSGSGISFNESGNKLMRGNSLAVVNGWLVPSTFITRKQQKVNAAGETKEWVDVNFSLQTSTETESYSIEVSPRNES